MPKQSKHADDHKNVLTTSKPFAWLYEKLNANWYQDTNPEPLFQLLILVLCTTLMPTYLVKDAMYISQYDYLWLPVE